MTMAFEGDFIYRNHFQICKIHLWMPWRLGVLQHDLKLLPPAPSNLTLSSLVSVSENSKCTLSIHTLLYQHRCKQAHCIHFFFKNSITLTSICVYTESVVSISSLTLICHKNFWRSPSKTPTVKPIHSNHPIVQQQESIIWVSMTTKCYKIDWSRQL